MFIYVEHDERLQIYFLKLSTNSDKYESIKLADLVIWNTQDVSKASYSYSFKSPNEVCSLVMTHQKEAMS
jgi:hypothetical protein